MKNNQIVIAMYEISYTPMC